MADNDAEERSLALARRLQAEFEEEHRQRGAQEERDRKLARAITLCEPETSTKRKRDASGEDTEEIVEIAALPRGKSSSSASPARVSSSSPPRKRLKRASPSFVTPGPPPLFYLNRAHGVPKEFTMPVNELFPEDMETCLITNYMVSMSWLLRTVPRLAELPCVLVHGEKSKREIHKAEAPVSWEVLYPESTVPTYGTHHSKMFVIFRPGALRVVVHTSNLIGGDWSHKTQGVWFEDYPRKTETSPPAGDMEDQITSYFLHLKLPPVTALARRFGEFDFSGAKVRLVASVPGYFSGPAMRKWGHPRLRALLEREPLDTAQFGGTAVIFQYSSLGSVSTKWVDELNASFRAHREARKEDMAIPPAVVFPTVEEVRESSEGYIGGGSIPCSKKNADQARFLRMHRWRGGPAGRDTALPHIKSYCRPSKDGSSVAWFLLTSSNLSKAAWGELQKGGTQVQMRSYEIGVLFLASAFTDPGQPPVRFVSAYGRDPGLRLPIPYSLSPMPYQPGDEMWVWDKRHDIPDRFGNQGYKA